MHNPWIILLAGVGTVFIALILIIMMLMLFRVIFSDRKAKKTAAPTPHADNAGHTSASVAPASGPVALQPASAEGPELVAVITAAIAAATGLSPAGFRIASIQAESGSGGGFNTPVWGRVERFNRS